MRARRVHVFSERPAGSGPFSTERKLAEVAALAALGFGRIEECL